MKVLILGATPVGRSLTEVLLSEDHEVTVLDQNSQLLEDLQTRADVRTVAGTPSHPHSLREAGAQEADMLVALTNSDEMNLMACQVSYRLFRTPRKIALVNDSAFFQYPQLFGREAIPVDMTISTGETTARHIQYLLRYPGTLQVCDFSEDTVQMAGVLVQPGAPLVGYSPPRCAVESPGSLEFCVVGIFRDGRPLPLNEETLISEGDELFFMSAKEQLREVVRLFHSPPAPYRSIMIGGGGRSGKRLAELLEDDYRVKLIDSSRTRCDYLADQLRKTMVLHGDALDAELLQQENISQTDVFCALTNDDEDNIMSALLAKAKGARRVIPMLHQQTYIEIMPRSRLDTPVVPQFTILGSLLAHVRHGHVLTVHAVRHGHAEALEIVAHGDESTSHLVGRRLDQLRLPAHAAIGALTRKGKALIATPSLKIQTDDHLMLLLADKSQLRKLEKLFQVSFSFF